MFGDEQQGSSGLTELLSSQKRALCAVQQAVTSDGPAAEQQVTRIDSTSRAAKLVVSSLWTQQQCGNDPWYTTHRHT